MKPFDPIYDPMQHVLAGVICGYLASDGRAVMKILRIVPVIEPPSVEVHFASGLRLVVKVEVLELPKASET